VPTTPSPPGLRVLHLVSSTDRRGAETAALSIAHALAERYGHRSEVVALAPGGSGGLGLPTLGPSRFAPSGLWSLRRRAQAVEVVVAHGSSTLPAAALALAEGGAPWVYRSIGDPLAWVNTPARRARVRLALARAASVVALWPAAAVHWHEALGVPAARVAVISNACPAGHFATASAAQRAEARAALGLAEDLPVALCLGALSPEKRVDLAIAAVARMDDVVLVVAGDGPRRAALEAEARRSAPGRVRFLGELADPRVALAAAEVLVVPSDTEGQPAVAIEAGLSGLPVVATRVGGLAEIVDDGRSGFLVPPGDVAALAGAVRAALADGPAMGEAGRRACRTRFDLDVVAAEWDRLLRSAAAPGRPWGAR
jgi:glycosyltransferase involved in cell wall biosynthesis